MQSKRNENFAACRLCGYPELFPTGLTTCLDAIEMGPYEVWRCPQCGNGLTIPLPSESSYELPVEVLSRQVSPGAQYLLERFMQLRLKRVLGAVHAASSRHLALLDVGAGACHFANVCQQRGMSVTMIEPNPKNSEKAAPGVAIIQDFFSEKLLQTEKLKPGSFDIITLWHSLEHMRCPEETLTAAIRLLKPGGILYLSVPDFDSLQRKIGQNFWTYLDVPHHINHFTFKGLSKFMSRFPLRLKKRFLISIEYEIFGWTQTLLNLLSCSHNYYYHKVKHGINDDQRLRYPYWTRFLSLLAFLFVLPALVFSMIAWMIGKPCVVEAAYEKTGNG